MAFKWTTDDAGGLDGTSPNSSVFTPKPRGQAVLVHHMKESTAQTQNGTLYSTRLTRNT